MDNQNKQTPRKVHDLNTQIEEESLWDLEDDWDDAPDSEPNTSSEQESPAQEVEDHASSPSSEEDSKSDPIADDKEEELISEPVEKAPLSPVGANDEFDFSEDDELDEETLVIPEDEADDLMEEEARVETQIDPADEKVEEVAPDSIETAVTEPAPNEDSSEPEVSQVEALVEPLKKLSLSASEKIALSAVAIIFMSLVVWGIVFIKKSNTESENADALELPKKGAHATITELTTFWKVVGKNSSGRNREAVVVPAASITLGDDSSSGSLKIFFKNSTQEKIGDTVTLYFNNGTFENGTKTREVSASNGFWQKGDFYAYQMDSKRAWTILIEESGKDATGSGSYSELLSTKVEPNVR